MAGFLSGNDYLALPRDPHSWIIKDLIPTGGLVNLFGKPKTGKTFAALGMGLAISTGQREWLNFPVLKHGPVAYLEIDTPRGEWSNRISDIREAGYDVSKLWFADMQMSPYPFNILDPEHFKWLSESLAAIQPVVVFIDTLREAHNGDENDSTVMRNVVTSLVAACRPAAIGFISHARKDGLLSNMGGDDLMNDARGSSYIAGRMDAVVKFTRTRLQYKGRSRGEGELVIQQNVDTGLVELDPKASAYFALIQRIAQQLLAEDRETSGHAIALAVEQETDYRKLRTIESDVREYLDSIGLKPRRRKKS